MKILIDGMGGDYAPEEIVKGACQAAAEIDETVAIIGPEERIYEELKKNRWQGDNIEVVDATEVISNHETPAMAVRKKKDSTIVKGMNMVKDGSADIFISGGSTGALLAGGLVLIGRLKGIRRPAIAAWFPRIGKEGNTLLLDCGANVESKPEYIFQNGLMGSIFVEGITNNTMPSVKLLNVGAEEGKGDDLHKGAYEMLKASGEAGHINFEGNIEARDIVFGEADVVVTDGFSGNVFLKGSEGIALAIMKQFKKKLTEGIVAKAGAMLAYSKIKDIKEDFDYSDAGGAPILGLKAPVLKIHGNSEAIEVYYAIHRAVDYVKNDITGMIANAVSKSESLIAGRKEPDADE